MQKRTQVNVYNKYDHVEFEFQTLRWCISMFGFNVLIELMFKL